jgi:hypothetical protein
MREVKSIGYGARRARTQKIVRPWTDLSLKAGSAAALAVAARAPLGNDWMNAALAGVGVTSLLVALKKFDDITVAIEGEAWDLDNLIKPTRDAMEGVFGLREWKGAPQATDDRVDRIVAVKRLPQEGELAGATIDVWVIIPE